MVIINMEMNTYLKAKQVVEDIEDLENYISVYEHILEQNRVTESRKEKIKDNLWNLHIELANKKVEFINL